MNWREGLDSRMSSGRVISWCLIMTSANMSKVNIWGWPHTAKCTYGTIVPIHLSFFYTYVVAYLGFCKGGASLVTHATM